MTNPTEPAKTMHNTETAKQAMVAANDALEGIYNWMREPDGAKDWDIYYWLSRRPIAEVRFAQSLAAELEVALERERVLRGNQALHDVIAERSRQISEEGWTSEHDDAHGNGEMAVAAACYAAPTDVEPESWPWAYKWWKPTTPRRNLVKAAALILAEIERLDRLALSGEAQKGEK